MTPSLERASLLLAVVMLLVIVRPRNLPIALAALLGAGASLALHLVSLHDVVRVLSLTWNATLALVTMTSPAPHNRTVVKSSSRSPGSSRSTRGRATGMKPNGGALACGSRSMASVLWPRSANAAPTLSVLVVFAVPPF